MVERSHGYPMWAPAIRVSNLSFPDCLGLLAQVCVKEPGVASISPEEHVSYIAEQRDKPNAEVQHDIGHHSRAQHRREAAVDLTRGVYQRQGHKNLDNVADSSCEYEVSILISHVLGGARNKEIRELTSELSL